MSDVAHDLTTDIGRVRFTIAEKPGAPVFTDAEVQYALDTGGSVNGAAAVLIRQLLVSRSRRASLFAEPEPGAPVPDDAASIVALREMLKAYGGDSVAIPRAIIGSLGASPSDGSGCGVPVLRRCGC